MSVQLTEAQYKYLMQGISPSRVRVLAGKGSHVESWDVRRTLIRVFGIGGFAIEDRGTHLVREIEYPPGAITYGNSGKTNNRTVWTVVYRVDLRLVVKDQHGQEISHFDDSATGDAIHQPSLGDAHDLAVKTAHSQALKRCAVNLGDQFGLSLYNDGSHDAVVVGCAVRPVEDAPEPTADDAPAVLGGEMGGPSYYGGDTTDYAPPVGHGDRDVAIAADTGPSSQDVRAMEAALLFAQAATRAPKRDRLLGIHSQGKTMACLDVDVSEAVTPAEAMFLGFTEPPVTLTQWVSACGKYVTANGRSVFDAVRASQSEGVQS